MVSELHHLGNGSVSTELQIDAKFTSFYISGFSTEWILHESGCSGPNNVGDSLARAKNSPIKAMTMMFIVHLFKDSFVKP